MIVLSCNKTTKVVSELEPWTFLLILIQNLTVNHVHEIMTKSKISSLTQLCQIQPTQFLNISSSAQTNYFMAKYLVTGNTSNFHRNAEALVWLHECKHYLLQPFTHKEKFYDKLQIYYQDKMNYCVNVSVCYRNCM